MHASCVNVPERETRTRGLFWRRLAYSIDELPRKFRVSAVLLKMDKTFKNGGRSHLSASRGPGKCWKGRCQTIQGLRVRNYPEMGCLTIWGVVDCADPSRGPWWSESGLTQWFELSISRSREACRPLIREGLFIFMAGSGNSRPLVEISEARKQMPQAECQRDLGMKI